MNQWTPTQHNIARRYVEDMVRYYADWGSSGSWHDCPAFRVSPCEVQVRDRDLAAKISTFFPGGGNMSPSSFNPLTSIAGYPVIVSGDAVIIRHSSLMSPPK